MRNHDIDLEKLDKRLKSAELRISMLESALLVSGKEELYNSDEKIQTITSHLREQKTTDEDKGLESTIGQFGLAWLGNIVLLVGISLLTQYLMIQGYRFFSILLGYTAVAGIFLLANYLKKTNEYLSFMFKINAQMLLFYVTLRLHFFSITPLLPNKSVSIVLLLLLVAFQSYLAIKSKSQVFAVLSVIFALITAVISDATHFMLPIVTMTAAGAVYYSYRFSWKPLLFGTIILSYISFFLWLFGNPLMDHQMQLISEQHGGVIYLFGLGACYSIMLLTRKKDTSEDDFLIGVTFINGILFTVLLLLVVIRFFTENYVALFSVITIFCLLYSTVLHSRSDWNFASAFYALYGFMAMSIALYGLFGFPDVYLLLPIQSMVVVSMALMFRNKLIIIMNSLLFLTIFTIYLLSSKSISGVNFSFALVSLISARIINWKRERLNIETEFIRNLYLVGGFLMVLYALLHAVPKQFVTFSWTMAALLYFILSFLLKNVKYRYMALGTMICAAFYLFIVDLARIEIVFRVLALLFLASISIGISIYYTSRSKRSDS